MILGAVGFMLGTGGSALVAYTLGAGDEKRANEIFSLLIYVLIGRNHPSSFSYRKRMAR